MAFKAILDLDGTEYTLESCNYSLHQHTDSKHNKPTSMVQPSPISMEVRVNKDNIKKFWTWAMKHNEVLDGSIKFFKIEEDSSLYELKFKNGFCTSFTSSMSSSGASDMTINIEVSAQKIEIDGEGFEMEW